MFSAQRTLVDEVAETSERAALRKFLYSTDLPDVIDVAAIRIERLSNPDKPAALMAPPLAA